MGIMRTEVAVVHPEHLTRRISRAPVAFIRAGKRTEAPRRVPRLILWSDLVDAFVTAATSRVSQVPEYGHIQTEGYQPSS